MKTRLITSKDNRTMQLAFNKALKNFGTDISFDDAYNVINSYKTFEAEDSYFKDFLVDYILEVEGNENITYTITRDNDNNIISINSIEADTTANTTIATVYGYARCSTNEDKQDINRQKRELSKLGIEAENIYFEYVSGTKTNTDRVELTKLLNALKPNDTLISLEISRLSRNTKDLLEIIEILKTKQVKLVVANLVLDFRPNQVVDSMVLAMTQIMGVFAELERNYISERTKSGLENARSKGTKLGRPSFTFEDIPKDFIKYYEMYKMNQVDKAKGLAVDDRRGIKLKDLLKLTNVSKNTAYKYIDYLENKDNFK